MTQSLTYLLKNIPGVVTPFTDVDITGMTLDSRDVVAGSLFVALNGTQSHGLSFAAQAEQAGAVAVLWEYDETVEVPVLKLPLIAVTALPAHLGEIAGRFYARAEQPLQVVGVTGTDGKTSVSHFLAQALNAANEPCAIIGTLGIGRPEALQTATHTTPDVISVHNNLQQLSAQGNRCVAMEVSSHALQQQRVAGVAFEVAVLTNLSRDHLDYHGTVEAYADAKARLFLACQPASVVLNLDDDFGMKMAQAIARSGVKRYGYAIGHPRDFPANTLVASDTTFDPQGIRATVSYLGESYALQAAVLGDFNLSNLLAVAGSLIALGHAPDVAMAMLSTVTTVPGRIEKVEHAASQNFLAVVDYAHTPGALASVLSALRTHCTGRLICVFGCGGDRDKGKRPLMAGVAERLADVVIVTDDNPRHEEATQIVDEMMQGFVEPASIRVEHDRALAISQAMQLAKANDVVLVAGKGHEQSQLIKGQSFPFDDREHIRQALAKLAERAVA